MGSRWAAIEDSPDKAGDEGVLAYSDTIHFLVCHRNGGTDGVDGPILFASLKLVQKKFKDIFQRG